MINDYWKRELTIAAAVLAFGFFALPFAIYWVGQRVIGEYAQDAGVLDLAEQIWSELLHLEPAAWILVLSPYVVIQLTRLAIRLWRLKSL
jgi:hypothetical protein